MHLNYLKTGWLFLAVLFSSLPPAFAERSLEQQYQAIKTGQAPLLNNQPIIVVSNIAGERLKADVYVVTAFDFNKLSSALVSPRQWCQFITLHLNIKACTYQARPEQKLSFYAGRKFYEPAENAFELDYRFKVVSQTENKLQLQLSAKEGPFSTSDYRILIELQKFGEDMLVHFALAYNSSWSSRAGTSVYLATLGADKVGFSRVKNDQGSDELVQGVAGIIERNVMRYYLALQAFMEAGGPDEMTTRWFELTEQYHRQLFEIPRQEYLENKKREYAQQQTMQNRLNQGLPVFEADESY